MEPVKLGASQSGAFSANNTLEGAAPGAPALPLQAPQPSSCGIESETFSDASQALAVRSLLDAYSRPASQLSAFVAGALETGATSSATPRTDNNAARTSSRDAADVYAQAGYTSNGDGVFAGVAALKQHDSKSGADIEVFSASAQVGAQSELQAGLARIGQVLPHQLAVAAPVPGQQAGDDEGLGAVDPARIQPEAVRQIAAQRQQRHENDEGNAAGEGGGAERG